ncbi:MAG: peptidoglycan-binding protein [Pseudomonadales bacterium]
MNKFSINILGLACAVGILQGCASTTASTQTTESVSNADLEVYKRQLEEKNQEIARLRDASISADTGTSSSPAGMSSDLFPPNAEPGHCYARVLIPATFQTTSETVLEQEASFRYEVIPATYETVSDSVLVKEASTRLEIVPATYKEVTEQVLVRAASTRIEDVPAQYETQTETILDKAAHTVWKRGAGPVDGALQTAVDQGTGEVMCLVEVPATYKTIKKTVLLTPATTREIEIPAEYRTITRTVVDTPASTVPIEIPAVYKTVSSEQVATPAQKRKIDIPAKYATLDKRTKINDESLEWREVLCKVNLTSGVVQTMQSALSDAGYLRGSADGVLGPNTLRAANEYARANKLPSGSNYIAIETAKSLGVNL